MVATVNADLTVIPDQAEAWYALKADVVDISAWYPATPTADPQALGWKFVGLVDADAGIPLDPSIEVREYDAFGHPRYRVKLRKGKLDTGFTMLENNAATRAIALPGSANNKIGIPRDVQIYVLYRFVDEDRTTVWVSERPGAAQITASTGIKEGEPWSRTVKVLHTGSAAGDAFHVIDATLDDVVKTYTIAPAVTTYTSTVNGVPTASIATKTALALESALRLIAPVIALPAPGVTVVGPTGGPLVATFTGPVTTVIATGTGGTVTVA
jgi:hypothetical protein